MKKYDLAVVIGRFQGCVHRGHLQLLKTAQEVAYRTLVCVGSSGIARSIKNPFTFEERESMIRTLEGSRDFPYQEDSYLNLTAIRDQPYNDNVWVRRIQGAVQNTRVSSNVALVGHKKDDSTYYLDMFPKWDYVPVETVYNGGNTLDATTIRDILFGQRSYPSVDLVPVNVLHWLEEWKANHSQEFEALCEEYEYLKSYKASWAKAPYPPTFVTTDAVVICSGHILLVKRRMAPGKGLWALPGGFLEQNIRVRENTIKELKEETRIKVTDPFLYSAIKLTKVYDHPNRSLRGRTVTHASLLNLGHGPLPHTRGGDDAERTKWVPIHDFIMDYGDKTFEDHHDIATDMIYS